MAKYARPINDDTPNVTSAFGPKHKGVDYGYIAGTPVYASESGKIIAAKTSETRQWVANEPGDPYKPATGTRPLKTEDYGNFLKIDHGNSEATLYAHLKHGSVLFRVGDTVKKGQKIAEVGSTGNSTGNHLHWETRKNDVVVDPVPLMDSSFTNYSTGGEIPMEPTVAVPSKDFAKLVHNSEQWDKTVAEYKPGNDPQGTQFEEVRVVVAGYKSRTTDLENQLKQEKTDHAVTKQEVVNRTEQVANVKAECQREKALLEAQIKAMPDVKKIREEYEGTIVTIEGQLREAQKSGGIKDKEIASLKKENELLLKGIVPPSVVDKLINYIKKIFGKK